MRSGNRYIRMMGHVILAILLFSGSAGWAHGYIFKYARDEMQNDIRIYFTQGRIQVEFRSVYYGQIAPHIRLMLDKDGNQYFSRQEIQQFINEYSQQLTQRLQQIPFLLDGVPYVAHLEEMRFPTIFTDSLLAPLGIVLRFSLSFTTSETSNHQLQIDPRWFFLPGNLFIDLAVQRVAFTQQQVQALGRYMQIQAQASPGILFLSCFPGRIKHRGKEIFIFGVFYEKSLLALQKGQIAPFQITWRYDTGP